MNDNLFSGTLLALVAAVAVAAASAVVELELEFGRPPAQAAAPSAAPAVAELPRVTVIGHRQAGDPGPNLAFASSAPGNRVQ